MHYDLFFLPSYLECIVLSRLSIQNMPKRVLKKFKLTHLVALDAAGSKLLLIAGGTVDLLLTRDEALGAYGGFAYTATEALFMPLTCLILHLLCACHTNKKKTLSSDECNIHSQ
jgi:hypothetical protein